MTTEQLRLAYYRGGGPSKPYRCGGCGQAFAVSDERREHPLRRKCAPAARRQHKKEVRP